MLKTKRVYRYPSPSKLADDFRPKPKATVAELVGALEARVGAVEPTVGRIKLRSKSKQPIARLRKGWSGMRVRRSKYNVGPPETRMMDNIVFASKREMSRYAELKLNLRCGLIRDLELQPVFPLMVNGVQICKYVADFRYKEAVSGKTVVEDVKGMRTAVYGIKRKLFAVCYPDMRLTEL